MFYMDPYLFSGARTSCTSLKPTQPIPNGHSMFGIDWVGSEVWDSLSPEWGPISGIDSVGLEGEYNHRALGFYSGSKTNSTICYEKELVHMLTCMAWMDLSSQGFHATWMGRGSSLTSFVISLFFLVGSGLPAAMKVLFAFLF